jgi:hypothetical protein
MTGILTPAYSVSKRTGSDGVNTVGVMGKGLASRAKYQFPDVYVRYRVS